MQNERHPIGVADEGHYPHASCDAQAGPGRPVKKKTPAGAGARSLGGERALRAAVAIGLLRSARYRVCSPLYARARTAPKTLRCARHRASSCPHNANLPSLIYPASKLDDVGIPHSVTIFLRVSRSRMVAQGGAFGFDGPARRGLPDRLARCAAPSAHQPLNPALPRPSDQPPPLRACRAPGAPLDRRPAPASVAMACGRGAAGAPLRSFPIRHGRDIRNAPDFGQSLKR